MLNIFTLANGRLVQEEIEALEELSKFQPIWVDLESPTLEEKRWIKQYYGLSIPEDAMDEDIEESARFYEEDNGELHIRSDFLIDDDENPRSVRVAFILQPAQRRAAQPRRAVLDPRRGRAGVPPAAHARAPRPGPDRGRQGSAAQALRRRRRVLGRHAGEHLRRARGRRQEGAVGQRQRRAGRRGAGR